MSHPRLARLLGVEMGARPPLEAVRTGISSKHTLALVNRGGATSRELLALAREIATGVRAELGVWLAPEPVLVGERW